MSSSLEDGKRHYQDNTGHPFRLRPEEVEVVAQRWLDAMAKYWDNPTMPIRKRYERLAKRLEKKWPEKAIAVKELTDKLMRHLMEADMYKAAITGIANSAGIKVKSGIILP